jgi:hypothetical protein
MDLKIKVNLIFKICDIYVIKIFIIAFPLKPPTNHLVVSHGSQIEEHLSRPFHFSSTF